MEARASFEAHGETLVFLEHFSDLPDPRQPGKVTYPLQEILLAVLAGAEGFVDIARFGKKKIELLRRFLPFEHGTPSHDQLGDIFATLDAAAFQRCFVAWVAKLIGVSADVVAIDGKTVRRSSHKRGGKAAIHMVSAFAARQRLVLGQVKAADKSNEIVAIPALLDMLAIEGAIVTIDAMGCQREIARKVIDKKADYILALKGNQGTLREDVELFAAEQKANDFEDAKKALKKGDRTRKIHHLIYVPDFDTADRLAQHAQPVAFYLKRAGFAAVETQAPEKIVRGQAPLYAVIGRTREETA